MRHLWLLPAIFILISLVACGKEVEQTRKDLGTASNCDAAIESCVVANGDIRVSLALGPDVKPLIQFPVQLEVEGGAVKPQSVVIDFQMQGMDMGMNRYRLQSSSHTAWHGKATLPVCTASRMDWSAVVEFTLDNQDYRTVFPFHTETN